MARRLSLKTLACVLGLVLQAGWAGSCAGAELTLKIVDKEPPKEVGESIRKTLRPKAVQLLDGEKPVYEFWFRAEIPLKAKPESPAKALPAIGETTLLGVAIVQGVQRDYKDNEVHQGVCTMRFAFQPQDGNHLGTAEYSYFAVLIPARNDATLEGISAFKPMVKASSRDTATDHPVVLSLRPGSADDGEFAKLNEPAPDHKSLRVKLTAKAPDSDQNVTLVFELVYKGKGKT